MLIVLVFCSHSAAAQHNVDQLTKQWLALDKSANQLVQHWQQEKQQLTFRISLLSHQNDNLRDKISRAENKKNQVNKTRQKILTEQTMIEQNINAYRQALPNLLDQVQQLMSRLPPQLSKQLAPDLENSMTKTALTAQYQGIANIVKTLTKNSKLISVKQGVININKQDLLTIQLYLGHEQAWFVTQDNSRAGIGYQRNNQWFWREDSQYAGNIRQAINYAKNQMPGPLLNLPIYLDNN
jgi:septal ring factor EnvC (AmiA/AmiB activator)